MDILLLTLKDKHRTLSPDAEESVRELLRDGMGCPNFGNGRYVRRLVERAMLHQASRLAPIPSSEIDERMLLSLMAEDFEPEKIERHKPPRIIGFCA